MELSTRCIPNRLPNLPYRSILQPHFSLPFKPINNPGLRYYSYSSIKATASEEASSGANQYVKLEPGVVNYSSVDTIPSEEASNGVNQYVKVETDDVEGVHEGQSDERSGFRGFYRFKDADAADDQSLQFDFLDKLKEELDFEDSFSIALLGVGGITALWLTTSIVGAIDHVPLFPKVMEAVGVGYSIWFGTRYLLFKRNRDELTSKIEEIKQQVLGSKN
ncbi:hypothetical protein QVD17_23843 [Tagetes erecta]|uniref:Cyanobacterial aminoacyl-tRNA synthetase CAAD domain-containing protein n=1 Tax=Tagetes erecta TaxID=13708 RepID=A0AAD8KEF8_TARER|nr:hypothetical protein QVD17_23843 [Tagetes erecta]